MGPKEIEQGNLWAEMADHKLMDPPLTANEDADYTNVSYIDPRLSMLGVRVACSKEGENITNRAFDELESRVQYSQK
jgi:hypothetical protein